jgi:hypothetical protein
MGFSHAQFSHDNPSRAIIALAPGAAFAGEWTLYVAQSPDPRGDRQNTRQDNGRADRREGRRGERVVVCSDTAWISMKLSHDIVSCGRVKPWSIATGGMVIATMAVR